VDETPIEVLDMQKKDEPIVETYKMSGSARFWILSLPTRSTSLWFCYLRIWSYNPGITQISEYRFLSL
jgi:hypothetical protein